jgi:hypothetical protein
MFGAQFRKNQFNSYNPSGSPQGTIGFGGAVTNKGASGNANTSMADFYLGLVNSGNYQTPMPETGRRNFNIGVFFQDDWKVTPKLTVNAGIRYEYEAPLYIANNIYSRISPSTGTLLVAGQNGASRSLNVSTPKLDFSPRIGFAFSANDKTVIRGAFGTFYGTIFQNLGGQLAYPGYDVTSNFTLNPNTPSAAAPPQGTPLSYTLDQTFSNANVIPRDLNNPVATINAYTVTNPLSVGAVSFNKMDKMPMVQQWNLGVQRQLPFGIIFEANYVGNHTLHLAYNIPYNLVPLTAANVSTAAIAGNNATNNAVVQPLRAFPRLKSFSGVDNVGMSNYNSLQIVGRRQFNTRFAVLSNYTYAKSMDDGSTIYNFSAPNGTANAQYIGDPNLRRMDYAVSNIDIKHRVSVAIQYTSAGPWWMRGWTVAPTFVGQTGLPLNITQSNNAAVDMSQQRPNGRIQDIIIKPYFDGTALRYYKNPSLSSIPAGDTSFPLTPAGAVLNTAKTALLTNPATPLGTMPRDAGRAFGIVEFDASVSKTFGLYRNLKFQLRLDAFNVLNHTNFGAPTTTLSSGSDCVKTGTTCSGPEVANFRGNSSGFGQITGTSTPARQMQVQGRITF